MPASPRSPFAYVILRVVPRVERGECINAGILLWSRPLRFLGARVHLDAGRLAALAPDCDPVAVHQQLDAIARVAAGDRSAGPIARLAKPERFHWLASPSSTIVQRSEVHTGITDDPGATLEHLFDTLVATAAPDRAAFDQGSSAPRVPAEDRR
jgi:hypothetical protein